MWWRLPLPRLLLALALLLRLLLPPPPPPPPPLLLLLPRCCFLAFRLPISSDRVPGIVASSHVPYCRPRYCPGLTLQSAYPHIFIWDTLRRIRMREIAARPMPAHTHTTQPSLPPS